MNKLKKNTSSNACIFFKVTGQPQRDLNLNMCMKLFFHTHIQKINLKRLTSNFIKPFEIYCRKTIDKSSILRYNI